MPALDLHPITLRTGSADKVGRLALVDGELAAVLVRLDDETHEVDRGKWFLEAEFRHLRRVKPFDTLDEAEAWLRLVNAD